MTESKSDEQVQKDVVAELSWDARVTPNEIGVIVKYGVITLTGRVDSYYKKWAAEDAAHRVRGVKAVVNDIEVKLPAAAHRSDDEIAEAAQHAIEADSLLGGKTIHLTVSNGWVTVKGEVEWNFQKQDTIRLLRRLWGIKGVTNLITVTTRPTPALIKDQIEKALVRCAELDARRIQVDVRGTKAILTGTVRSWGEREEAERAAWVAPGITQVEDHIQVSYYA